MSQPESCSPRSKKGGGGDVQTCFSFPSLERIARRYSAQNPRDDITHIRTKKGLWDAIQARMPQCSNERCWIHASYLSASDRAELEQDFKPPIPRGANEWLRTSDIDKVLEQYTKVYPSFAWLGTHPINFADPSYPKSKRFRPLNVTALKRKGVKKAAMVLNLDRYGEPGSHWVAVLLDLPRYRVEYFDSLGDAAPPEIQEFVKRLNSRARGGKWKLIVNDRTHQLLDSECGVYSIHFILKRLEGQSFRDVASDIKRDDEMNRKRGVFFDPHTTRAG